jgi:carboxylate-amine ligase
MADRERGFQIMNAARYFLPHVLALSTSSPVLDEATNTGCKSYRTEVFKTVSAHDIPDSLRLLQRLSNVRRSAGQDRAASTTERRSGGTSVRIPYFPTLEFAFATFRTRVDDTDRDRALFQAIVAKLKTV